MNSRRPIERRSQAAFTLVEVMLVVAILGVTLTIGIPSIFHAVRKSPMRQAISDLEEACRTARMMAIMEGRPTEMVIRAEDGSITVRSLSEGRRPPAEMEPVPPPAMAPEEQAPIEPDTPRPAPTIHFPTRRLPNSVAFKRLVINLRDMMEFDEARVRFFPNGTCDALTATLLSEENEERSLTLEITTARETVEVIR